VQHLTPFLHRNVLFASIREGGRYLAKMGRKEVQSCIAGLRQYGMSFEEAFDEMEHLQKIISDRQAFLQDLSNVRQSPSPNHHSSLPVNMSASPNSYSLSSMSNPPPSVSSAGCLLLLALTNYCHPRIGLCLCAGQHSANDV
jgi:hypothetical protein